MASDRRCHRQLPRSAGFGKAAGPFAILRLTVRRSSATLATVSTPAPAAVLPSAEHHATIGGNALRASVLGANDGLVSNLSLVMGVAGAGLASSTILITGVAGLLAGACSMAMGEWVSVTSSRELYQRELAVERAEIATDPAAERAELVDIYTRRGLDESTAEALSDHVMADPDRALEVMAREELGIDPQELGGSALTAAWSSFALFVAGAIVPVAPYFLLVGDRGRGRQRRCQRSGAVRGRRPHHPRDRPLGPAIRAATARRRPRRRRRHLRHGRAARRLGRMSVHDSTTTIDRSALDDLLGALRGRGYTVVGPQVRSGSIVYDELTRAETCPPGGSTSRRAGPSACAEATTTPSSPTRSGMTRSSDSSSRRSSRCGGRGATPTVALRWSRPSRRRATPSSECAPAICTPSRSRIASSSGTASSIPTTRPAGATPSSSP